MSTFYQTLTGGVAYIYSGVFAAYFIIPGLLALLSIVSVFAGLLGLFNIR